MMDAQEGRMESTTNADAKSSSPPLSTGSTAPPFPPPNHLSEEQRILIVRRHFERKGYRVRSGLQFGCELVLYTDDADRVHSDFCVHVAGVPEARLDFRTLQTLVRSMPDLRKTLIIASVRSKDSGCDGAVVDAGVTDATPDRGDAICSGSDSKVESDGIGDDPLSRYAVDELAIATEHAPLRHKRDPGVVGSQVKP